MFYSDYEYIDVVRFIDFDDDEDKITIDDFKFIKYPLELKSYIYENKNYSDIALKYIQNILFKSDNSNVVYDSILFCFEYGYDTQNINVVTELDLNNLCDIFNEERLHVKVWELLSYSDYSEFALEIIRHFGWVDSFYDRFVEEGSLESKICAELLLENISTTPYQDAEHLISDSKDDINIDTYLLPRIGYTKLAFEEFKDGLYGEALNSIDIAQDKKIYKLFPEYNNKVLEELESKILTEHNSVYKQIEKNYAYLAEFLTNNSKEAFIHAEYLFQVHGRALNEYSSILNAYSRCIEIQLKEVFLPEFKRLLYKYGSIRNTGRNKNKKFLIYLKYNSQKQLFDLPQYRYTLGTFHHLFFVKDESLDELIWNKREYNNLIKNSNNTTIEQKKKKEYLEMFKEETFYGALYEEYKTNISYKRLSRFGELLRKITKDYRNDASHGSVRDFNKVIEIRNDMGINNAKENIFELLSFSKNRSLIKHS